MVYKVKSDGDGVITKYKARFCARGFQQVYQLNFWESRSTVTDYSTVRTLFSIAAEDDLRASTIDIKNAFVSAELPESEKMLLSLPKNIHIVCNKSPKLEKFFRYKELGSDLQEEYVLEAQTALYGFHQSGLRFGQKLQGALKENGFRQVVTDECCYRKERNMEDVADVTIDSPPTQRTEDITICGWVDDLLVLTEPSTKDIKWLTSSLQKTFKLSPGAGDEASLFLGMKVTRDKANKLIKLSCEKSIQELLHDMADKIDPEKTCPTPMSTSYRLERRKAEEELVPEKIWPHRSVVGALNHLARTSRPDIQLASSELSRHLGDCAVRHVDAAKRVLYYLRQTMDLGIIFHGNQTPMRHHRLFTYSDSDWAGETDSRKSRSGHCVMMNSGPIDWYSKGQNLQTLSSCEAETVAAVETLKTLLSLRLLLIELSVPQPGSSTMYVDNMALHYNSHSQKQSSRSKYFQLRTEILRELTKLGRVNLTKIHTSQNIPDFFTKVLAEKEFIHFRDIIMGINTEASRAMCKCLQV